jgi:hypothetical protein
LLEESTHLGDLVVVVHDDAERAVPRGMDDLLVDEHARLRLRRDDVLHGDASSEERGVVDFVETFPQLEGPECLHAGWRISILILLEMEQDFDMSD